MRAQQACGHTAAAQSSGRASQLLTAAYGHGAERLAELSHAMRTTYFGRLWLPAAHDRRPKHQSRGYGRLKRCEAAYIVKLTLVLQKRYLPDHLRLQIVTGRKFLWHVSEVSPLYPENF